MVPQYTNTTHITLYKSKIINQHYTITNKQKNTINDYLRNYKKRKCLSLYLKVCAADWDKISYGMEFHKNGAAIKRMPKCVDGGGC